ncbi:MAG: glycosyltransferase family 2 protein [Bryobacteraceae bacterium]
MSAAAAVFLLSVCFIVYVLAGYPALLFLWPVRRRVAALKRNPLSVSVILPVRNGEKWIAGKLESIAALDYPPELLQVIVISDGSTDRTVEIASSYPGVEVLRIPASGKAAALNVGIGRATGELLFFTDVRQHLDRASLRALVRRFDDPLVGVASGELFIRRGDCIEEESVGLYWKYEKAIRKRHAAIDSVLGATGCIYTMRRTLASPIPEDTLNDDMHLPFQAFFQGYRLDFVEEAKAYDVATALDAEFYRKVRTQAGVYQVISQFPKLLGPANRMWFHFVSHKLARLLLPFALLAALMASLFLPAPWAAWALAAQAAGYGLAALDRWVPERSALKRLTSLTHAFVILMLAALAGALILFRSSRSFWKTPTAGT